MKIKMLIT